MPSAGPAASTGGALSATASNLQELAAWLTQVRGNPVKVVLETHRPVPLDFFVASTQGQVRPLDRIGELRPKRRPQDRRERRGDRPMSGRDRMRELERSWKRLVLTVSQRDELPLLFFLFSRAACEGLAMASCDEDLLASPAAGHAARGAPGGLPVSCRTRSGNPGSSRRPATSAGSVIMRYRARVSGVPSGNGPCRSRRTNESWARQSG